MTNDRIEATVTCPPFFGPPSMSVRSSLTCSLRRRCRRSRCRCREFGPGFGGCPVAAGAALAVVGDWAPDEEANLRASDDDPLEVVAALLGRRGAWI
jgi:hypothetical protein